MFVDKTIRNLLTRQEQTIMLASDKCAYKDNIYIFDAFTNDEVHAMGLSILKQIDKKEFFIAILEKLKFKL